MPDVYDIPVAFILYNRPDQTRQSFAAIRAARPAILYLIADGPKDAADAERVAAARRVVANVDWPCDVRPLMADTNLGCGQRVASGLDRVFAECDMAIVLEDDIVATPAFFQFCRAMLLRYADRPDLMAVCGWNGLVRYAANDARAFASQYMSVWGWATWQRAWAHYRYAPDWAADEVINRLSGYFSDTFRPRLYGHTTRHRLWESLQTWDMQWSLAIFMQGGSVLTSTVNLCRNIGFAAGGTHLHAFNFRALFPAFDTLPTAHTVRLTPDAHSHWYDYSTVLMSIFSLYDDVRKLFLAYRNPHLWPAHQDPTGWECSLQPFRDAAHCLRVLDYVAPYVSDAHLKPYRAVFQRAL